MEEPSWSTKESEMQYWMKSQKWQNDLSSFPRQTIQYHNNLRLCPKRECWRRWSWKVLGRPTRPPRINMQNKKDFLFIIGDGNAKEGIREIPGVTGKFGLGIQIEAEERLTEFCQENALVIANTHFQQHKRRLYTWTLPDGPWQIRLIIFFAAQNGKALYSQQKQDHELTVAHIMNSLLPNSHLYWRK